MQPEDKTHRGNQLFLLFIANRVNPGGKLFIFHEERISALAHQKPLIEIGPGRTGSSQVGQSAIILLEQVPKFRVPSRDLSGRRSFGHHRSPSIAFKRAVKLLSNLDHHSAVA